MPSNKEKTVAVKKKKKSHSLGWVAGVAVLIAISLVFIIPATAFRGGDNKIVFGSYGKKDIELSYGNYFFNQVNSLAAANPDASNVQIYYQAYLMTVFETALRLMADGAGIKATDSMINNTIKTSQYFMDENGNYDPSLYIAAGEMEKNIMRENLKETIPAEMAYEDILGVKTPRAETEFVRSMNDEVRAFEYVVIDSSLYPDADAALYLESNPSPFVSAVLSYSAYASEEDALKATENGEAFNVESARVYLFALESMLYDASDAEKIFSLEEGSVSEPIRTWYGYTVYRMENSPVEADESDPEVLTAVKAFIDTYESDTMENYLSSLADIIYSEFSENPEAAEDKYSLTIHSVPATSYNPSSSQFVIGIEYSDSYGALRNAALSSEEYYEKLFTTPLNTVTEPHKSGSTYIMAMPVEAEDDNKTLSSYITSMYESYIPDITAIDLQQAVFTSDKFDDNFYSSYYRALYGGN